VAAGRAGRGTKPGEVLLQTYYPEHYALTAAIAQDYERFFEQEMTLRRAVGYPPFTRLPNLLFDGAKEHQVIAAAQWVAAGLGAHRAGDDVRLLGPAPQPLSRLKGKFRWHLAIRAPRHRHVRAACDAAFTAWTDAGRKFSGVRMTVDVDPVDLL